MRNRHYIRNQVFLAVLLTVSLSVAFTGFAAAESATFRASVGVILINESGQVLALERNDIPDAWQMPQGGLDVGEDIMTAAKRELYEETRIDEGKIVFLGQHPEWLAYELPKPSKKHGLGQVHKWMLFRFIGEDTDIDLKATEPQEFVAFKWTTLRELANETVYFRKGIYREVADYFSNYLAE